MMLTSLLDMKFIMQILCFASTSLGIIVQVSSPFDPFRLECPNKHGIMKLTVQRIESVGGIRSDQMISSYCESLAKLYPSPRDGTSPNHDEKCRWTAPEKIPGTFEVSSTCKDREYVSGIVRQEINQYGFLCCSVKDRKRGKCDITSFPLPTAENPDISISRGSDLLSGLGFKDGKIIAQHCDFNILTQKEIDDEFIADAKAKLDKWFEADLKNRTSHLAPKTKTVLEKKPEVKPVLVRPPDSRLPVVKVNNSVNQFQQPKVIGPPSITPSFAQRNSFTRPTIIVPQFTRVTPRQPTELTSKENDDRRKSVVKPLTSIERIQDARPPSILPSNVTRTTRRGPSTPVTRSSTRKVTSSTTTRPRFSTTNKTTTHTPNESSPLASESSPILSESSTKRSESSTKRSESSTRRSESSTKRSESSTRPTVSTTQLRSKTTLKSKIAVTTTIDDRDDSSDESESPHSSDRLSFPRLPLHREDLASFNSLQTEAPKGKTLKGSSSLKSVSTLQSKVTSLSKPVTAVTDENDVIYVDGDLSSTKKPSTDKLSDSNEYYYYYEDGQPASTKPSRSTSTVTPKAARLSSSGRSNDVTRFSVTVFGSSTTVRPADSSAGSNSSTRNIPQQTSQAPSNKLVCDTRQAAVSSASGLVIACGQGQDIWSPPRCPKDTFCMESANSNFRVCCSAEFAVV